VSRQEFVAFKKLFPMATGSEQTIKRMFDEAVAESGSPIRYASQIIRLFPNRPRMLETIFERMVELAASDGVISLEEQQLLWQVSETFGFPRSYFNRQLGQYSVARNRTPYEILGVHPTASDEHIHKRHRQLIREYHPDGLAAYGYSEAETASAAARLAVINQAYTEIRKLRSSQRVG
jgi:DnaJ like chaperone protein